MLCIGVNKIKIHFDTSQLCCGVVHCPTGIAVSVRSGIRFLGNKEKAFDLMVAKHCDILRSIGTYINNWMIRVVLLLCVA